MSRFSEPLRRTLVSFVGVAAFLTGIVAIPAAPAAAAVTATHFKVEATPSSVTAGDATTITVTAQGDGDVTATGYNGTVHFSVDNPQPTETLPSDTAFDGTTGVLTITDGVTLTLAGSRTLKVTDATDDAISGSTTDRKSCMDGSEGHVMWVARSWARFTYAASMGVMGPLATSRIAHSTSDHASCSRAGNSTASRVR